VRGCPQSARVVSPQALMHLVSHTTPHCPSFPSPCRPSWTRWARARRATCLTTGPTRRARASGSTGGAPSLAPSRGSPRRTRPVSVAAAAGGADAGEKRLRGRRCLHQRALRRDVNINPNLFAPPRPRLLQTPRGRAPGGPPPSSRRRPPRPATRKRARRRLQGSRREQLFESTQHRVGEFGDCGRVCLCVTRNAPDAERRGRVCCCSRKPAGGPCGPRER
jgi:hypothetical protein